MALIFRLACAPFNPLNKHEVLVLMFNIDMSISPSSEEEFASYQALANRYAQSCMESSTPPGILAHIGTAETIQDWDSLREALGYDTMDFLTIS